MESPVTYNHVKVPSKIEYDESGSQQDYESGISFFLSPLRPMK